MLEPHKIDLLETAQTGVGWVAGYQKLRPDVCLVDLILPKETEFFVLKKYAALTPR